jgi:hypothetical protein
VTREFQRERRGIGALRDYALDRQRAGLLEERGITAQSVGSEGLSSRLAGMLEALVADHARRGKQSEVHGRVTRSRR